ncbi:MAG: FkbM family methyltransferase [Alphaproteobacteria bacterium]|nr:FkbM family methyltransferase [Alphaproteobacteria bacterium]
MNLLNRIKSANKRLQCASQFTGSYLAAVYGFTRYKLNRTSQMNGTYKDIPFAFRSSDVEALKEVLVNEDYKFLGDYIKQQNNPVIIDAGHHIGCFSLWALAQNPKANITALEADPNTYKVAKKNAELAKAKGYDWKVLNKAAWTNNDPVSFSCDGDTMGHKVLKDGTMTIDGMSLESLLDQVGEPVTLMKVDIEGAEEAFLSGKDDLLKKIKALVIEIHPKYCNQNAVVETLKKSFSHVEFIEDKQTDKPLVWCTNNPKQSN